MSLTTWLLIVFVLKSEEYKPLELLKEFNTFDHKPLNYLRNSILGWLAELAGWAGWLAGLAGWLGLLAAWTPGAPEHQPSFQEGAWAVNILRANIVVKRTCPNSLKNSVSSTSKFFKELGHVPVTTIFAGKNSGRRDAQLKTRGVGAPPIENSSGARGEESGAGSGPPRSGSSSSPGPRGGDGDGIAWGCGWGWGRGW